MKKIILVVVLFYSGCSKPFMMKSKRVENKVLSCEVEAKAKSLQFLEQQYRCTSK
ncbi:MAG: Unknown protein [uncultured Sulfurovum sp.]|uniref:Uncharacterized protein n=1 Tax=uncultured Sulfurovum sp. TaxID=269237 RepID=A0A6S6U512_9BACT|nr:MAG: Unknown protein [uncultured Sulfurovum sp.]